MPRLSDHEQIMLEHHVAIGNVTKKAHDWAGLWIYNYSKQCQFEGNWDFHTLRARGLILDEDYNIVARGMNKFFNYGEELAPKWTENTLVSATNKLDGSLGILYCQEAVTEGNIIDYAIATRGSFNSEQAQKATEILQYKYPNWSPHIEITYLFEIIYPENRIVLDYGDEEDLHLLGIVFNETGEFIPANYAAWGWPGPRAELVHANIIFGDLLKLGDRTNAEGYVVRDLQGRMAKVKQDDYVQIHRIVTNLTPRRIWEAMRDDVLDDVLAALPESFKKDVLGIAASIWFKYDMLKDMIIDDFAELRNLERKEFAEQVKDHPYKGMLFYLLDGRDIDKNLWMTVKP